ASSGGSAPARQRSGRPATQRSTCSSPRARRRRPSSTATARCTDSEPPSAGSESAPSTRSRSAARSPSWPSSSGSPPAASVGAARTRSSVGLELREDAEGRLADGQLAELRVDARGALAARLVGRLDLGLAHRQGLAHGADRTEAGLPPFGRPQHVEVDLDVVDLLHAADVCVTPRFVRVDEGTAPREARPGIHDLVAVDVAATALHLVLRMKGEGERQLLLHVRHCGSVLYPVQVLTYTR